MMRFEYSWTNVMQEGSLGNVCIAETTWQTQQHCVTLEFLTLYSRASDFSSCISVVLCALKVFWSLLR